MLDHLSLQCADVDAAVSFYLRVFAACGVREAMRFDHPDGAVVGLSGPDGFPKLWFGAMEGPGDRPVHLALTAPSREAVDAVFAAAQAAGAEILHEPGRHPEYHPGYYGGFFRDPDGNNVEAVHHGFPRLMDPANTAIPPSAGSAPLPMGAGSAPLPMGAGSAPWWTKAVVYQVYPRSFQDSDGDGIGDLGGVLQRLDHLSDLGVDVLWLSPVYPSPQADNGYDISDYQGIDPLFGTLAQLDELIAALHGRGMRLVMDLVVNHTSDQHPWFTESRSSLTSPKRDWYWWRPPRGGMAGHPGAEPTNWQSFFSGPTWEYDDATGEYYLHLFAREQPDLNWENPEVRQATYAMMRWWLDRGVDGFRMDVINMISKDVAPDGHLHDGPQIPGSALGDGSASYLCGPRIHEFLQEMHREVFSGRSDVLLAVGEMPGVTVEEARLFTDPARAEVDMVFQFEHVSLDIVGDKWHPVPLKLRDLKASFGRWQAALAEVGWNSLYWDNHDQPRAVSRFGDDSPQFRRDSATCLATLLHLHRGTPYVYQGEELGMANFPFASVDEFRDVESVNYFGTAMVAGEDPTAVLTAMRRMSRDNARTPVQWDATEHAGFTTGTPWLPVNPDHAEWNAAAQREDDTSVLAHYRRLIALRHEKAVVALGGFAMLLPDHEHVYAFTRTLGLEQLLVVCNVGATPYPLAELLPAAVGAELVLGNLAPTDPSVLAPWEARVLRVS